MRAFMKIIMLINNFKGNPWGPPPKKATQSDTSASAKIATPPPSSEASDDTAIVGTSSGYSTRSVKLRLPTEDEIAIHKAKTSITARAFDPSRPRANFFARYPLMDLDATDVSKENRDLPIFGQVSPLVESDCPDSSDGEDEWRQVRLQIKADSNYAATYKKARNKKPPKSPQRLSPYKMRLYALLFSNYYLFDHSKHFD